MTNSCWSYWKIPVGETSRTGGCVVLRHGRTCEMLARIGRRDIVWSVNKFAHQRTGACDRRLARLMFYIYHTNDHRQNCHVGNTAHHCRLDFGESLMYFWKPNICPHQLDVQEETSVSHSSTESEIFSSDAGLRMDGLRALVLWDVMMEVSRSSNSTKTPTNLAGNCSRNHKSKPKQRETEMLIHCRMWTTPPQTQIFLKASLSCTSLKTMKQWSKWSLRAEVQRWDTCQEPTELRLIGYSTESSWTHNPNPIHWHQKPARRHFNQRTFHTWWVESFVELV